MMHEEPQANSDKVNESTGAVDQNSIHETSWSPERKIMGAAVAVVLMWLLQAIFSVDAPIAVEGALTVLVGYFIPNERR